MKIALIAKNQSRSKKSQKLITSIETILGSYGDACDLFVTEYHQHALTIVRDLKISEYDRIVSCGGDGTNYQIVNGLLKYHDKSEIPPLAIIPAGRGNSFARDLDIFSIDDGVRAMVGQNTKAVDVCTFTQGSENFYFVNLMGLGFIADVAATAARFRRIGDISYALGVVYRTGGLQFHKMQLTIDGKTIDQENCFVEFCNSRYTGGSMLMAPTAQLDDGLFDVVIASPLGRLSLLKSFPKIYRGKHVGHPAIRIIQGKQATLSCAPPKRLLPDGELFGETPTEIKILPQYLRYCI